MSVCLSTNGEYLCRALALPFFSEPRPQPLSIQSLPYRTLATLRHVQTCLTWISLESFLNISLYSLNSVTKIFVITVKSHKPLVLETRMLPQHQQDTHENQYLYIQPNSFFSNSSNYLSSLNSLNSM